MDISFKKLHLNITINALFFCFILPCDIVLSQDIHTAYKKFRSMHPEQEAVASAERDAVDLMFSEYRNKYRINRSMYPELSSREFIELMTGPIPQQQIDDYQKVISAYKEFVDKYEGTEIAAYCHFRLCAPYKQIGQYHEAIIQYKIAAIKYAGTSYETRAYSSIANIFQEQFNDPLTAIAWLNRILKPNNQNNDGIVTEEKYDEANMNYVSAQKDIAKCEIELGRTEDAVKRYEELSLRYPQFRDTFETGLGRVLLVTSQNNSAESLIGSSGQVELNLKIAQIEKNIEDELNLLKETYSSVLPDEAKKLGGFSDEEKAEYEQCLSLLKMRWNIVAERSDEVDEAIARLAAMGDIVIEPIIDDFNQYDQSFSFRHQAMRVFEAISSTKAKETLLKIALGQTTVDNKSQKTQASKMYISSLDNKAETKKLLVSRDTGVLNNALVALRGQTVDEDFLKRLTQILKLEIKELDELVLCRNAVSVIAEDPNSDYAQQKVILIINAIKVVPEFPQAEEFYSHSIYNHGETSYASYIDSLSKIQGIDSYLVEQIPLLSGRTRYCVIITLARRGDTTVKNELIEILKDQDADIFRAWSARCFEDIGTQDDIPMLQEIADSDPLERDPRDSFRSPAIFPVRQAAEEAIKAIEERTQ